MKQKILIILLFVLFIVGCQSKKINPSPKKVDKEAPISQEDKKEEIIETYHDENITPISFYQLNGNQLKKITMISGQYHSMDDLFLLQVFPSQEEVISLNESFANAYFHEYQKYPNIKVGFSLSFTLKNGENVFFNILNPDQAMAKWEYFMAYLYDDYVNQGKSFYSHIENTNYTDSTLFTAIKLQCGGYLDDVQSPVTLTVFTYDSEDDFLDGKYRGNSQASLTICMNGIC